VTGEYVWGGYRGLTSVFPAVEKFSPRDSTTEIGVIDDTGADAVIAHESFGNWSDGTEVPHIGTVIFVGFCLLHLDGGKISLQIDVGSML
jgi:hypothetical protein